MLGILYLQLKWVYAPKKILRSFLNGPS
jgi:hypothetical protein